MIALGETAGCSFLVQKERGGGGTQPMSVAASVQASSWPLKKGELPKTA